MVTFMQGRTIGITFWIAIAFAGVSAFCTSATAHPLNTIYSFCKRNQCRDGASPAGLAADPFGNLYGVAADGGGNGARGTAYELVGGKKFKLLHQFCLQHGCNDGAVPLAALVIDVDGNLYGTTMTGGAHGGGVAFKLAADGTYSKLYDFCSQGADNCTDGEYPVGGLTYFGAETGALYDGVSPLYGATVGRSSGGFPTVGAVAYRLTPGGDSWSESILYTFCSQGGANCTDGSQPNGALLPDGGGNLFGTTSNGGQTRLPISRWAPALSSN